MKSCNIYSFKEAYESLNNNDFENYLKYLGINLKEHEKYCLIELCDKIVNAPYLEGFFLGYEVPQIGTEFDIIRVGECDIINIELKSESNKETIKKQLIKNKYYLSAVEKEEKFYFTYVVSENKLYQLTEDNELSVVEFEYLDSILCNQRVLSEINLDDLFEPNQYLVSPFNATGKFVRGEYFLTTDQIQKKKEILKKLQSENAEFIAITGNPGTGKTLLTYDIAMTLMGDKKIVIVHCGMLNQGHIKLNENHLFNIKSAKYTEEICNDDYDIVIVDEAQRMYTNQLQMLYEYIVTNKLKCIFSYDARQVFTNGELTRNNAKKIEEEFGAIKYSLTNKIRTNKELATFTLNLFNKRLSKLGKKYKNVNIQYFHTSTAVKSYTETLKSEGWTVLNYTSSNYNTLNYDHYQCYSNFNAHDVIGQEFPKVAVVIDSNFRVEDDVLESIRVVGSPGYDLDKMLYQLMTRAREKLTIVVLKNPTVLNKCLKIIAHQ